MADNFINNMVEKQEIVRDDIRSLKEAIERLCVEITENSAIMRRIESYQAEQDARDERRVNIAEDVAEIAKSVVGLVEDMHSQNRLLTGLLEKLDKRISADSTLDDMLARMRKEE